MRRAVSETSPRSGVRKRRALRVRDLIVQRLYLLWESHPDTAIDSADELLAASAHDAGSAGADVIGTENRASAELR